LGERARISPKNSINFCQIAEKANINLT
jgi:hypothetical protein